MIYEILLRRKHKICLVGERTWDLDKSEENKESDQRDKVVTMMKNLEDLGYTFSKSLFQMLCDFSEEELHAFYQELVSYLKKYVGADRVYRPMYPNFPQEVMEKDGVELYFNAIVHYWSGGKLYPVSIKRKSLPFVPVFDTEKVVVLDVGTKEELMEIFCNLVSANTSLSVKDLKDIEWYFSHIPNVSSYLPEMIPIKENAAYIGKCYLESCPLIDAKVLLPYFRTATDVLRLSVALSDGDISLSEKILFKSFTRKERRILMELFAEASGLLEEMHRRPEMFKRLGERLHPGEFRAPRFQRVVVAFGKIRNGERISTFASAVEEALDKKDLDYALELLKTRPGELARRLDLLLRRAKGQQTEKILQVFEDVAEQAATPLLLQVRNHFQYRNHQEFRYYFPKGRLAKAKMIENANEPVEESTCAQVVSICEKKLTERFAELPDMGKVYLSEELKNYMVPFSQRSASKAARTLVRGSRLCLNQEAAAIRGFIWWTNSGDGERGRVDLDLSAGVFDEDWNYLEHVSYTNLRSKKYQICHSGDIVDGGPPDGEGVSEFLDIDIENVVKNGGRYVVYQVYSFTRQCFGSLPHVTFGYMERQDVNSGEIFEPRLVRHRMDVTSNTTVVVPMILDCKERRMIWCDAGLGLYNCRRDVGGNNLESNLFGVTLACYTMVNMHQTNLYDLVKMHIDGRGEICTVKEDADLVFDVEDGITPFDTDVIMAEYMI